MKPINLTLTPAERDYILFCVQCDRGTLFNGDFEDEYDKRQQRISDQVMDKLESSKQPSPAPAQS